jgi:DNA-binding NtrC family response regulator
VVWRDGMTMADVERETITTVLEMLGGNRRRAAQVLQIGERTLYRKLKEYHLD